MKKAPFRCFSFIIFLALVFFNSLIAYRINLNLLKLHKQHIILSEFTDELQDSIQHSEDRNYMYNLDLYDMIFILNHIIQEYHIH